MRKINPKNPISVFDTSIGKNWSFTNYNDLLVALKRDEFPRPYTYPGAVLARIDKYMLIAPYPKVGVWPYGTVCYVEDSCGKRFVKNALLADIEKRGIKDRQNNRYSYEGSLGVYEFFKTNKRSEIVCEYRKDSVPHTGKGKNYHYYRQIKSTSERREWFKYELELKESGYKIYTRASRSFKNLPDAWHDEIPRNYKDKSWKKFRKKQYKVKKNS